MSQPALGTHVSSCDATAPEAACTPSPRRRHNITFDTAACCIQAEIYTEWHSVIERQELWIVGVPPTLTIVAMRKLLFACHREASMFTVAGYSHTVQNVVNSPILQAKTAAPIERTILSRLGTAFGRPDLVDAAG